MSKNIIWGKRKSMADGKVSFAYSSFLGYDMGDDGHLYIVEDQAEIVHRIYDEFLAGKTTYDIAKRLTEDGIPTPMKKVKWQDSTVRSILQNVKYRGDSVLQSTFVEDGGKPEKAFVNAWNLLVSKKLLYKASLRGIAETETNALTRYRAEELILIIDNVGKIQPTITHWLCRHSSGLK